MTQKHHFKHYARQKVRELGFDGAVQYFLNEYRYYKTNHLYEGSWLRSVMYSMMLEYTVNDLGE